MYIICISLTSQQEFINKRQDLRPLTFRQLTVAVTTYNAPAHTISYTKPGPNLSCFLCRNKHRVICQPLVIRISQQQQSTWANKCT